MIIHKLFGVLSTISILALFFMLIVEAAGKNQFTRAHGPVCDVDEFFIEYPPAWTPDALLKNHQAAVSNIFALHSPDKNGHLYIQEIIQPKGMSLLPLDENMRGILGANLISSEATNLGGSDAITWTYMWPAPNTNPNVLDQCQVTAAIMESCIISISFCSEPASFYRYHSELDIIVESVEFSKK